jgi:hypothetical protein
LVGSTAARGWGRERVHIIDEQLAVRLRRGLWRYTLRCPMVLRQVVPVLIAAAVASLVCAWEYAGRSDTLIWWLMGGLPAVGVLAYVVIVLLMMRRHDEWLAREVVPGRFIAVTVGQESIRVRDLDSAVEYGYSLVTGVHQYDDVVVIEHRPTFWALPVELFRPHELSVIRERAGRAFLPPEEGRADRPLDVAGEAPPLRLSQRLGKLVR